MGGSGFWILIFLFTAVMCFKFGMELDQNRLSAANSLRATYARGGIDVRAVLIVVGPIALYNHMSAMYIYLLKYFNAI